MKRVEPGLAEGGDVARGGEDAGVTRPAAHRPGVVVVHRALVHLAPVLAGLGRREGAPGGARRGLRRGEAVEEEGVGEAEGPEHPRLGERGERPAHDLLEEEAEGEEAGIAVDGPRPRGRLERLGEHGRADERLPAREGGGERRRRGALRGGPERGRRDRIDRGGLVVRAPARQARRMGEEVPERHGPLPAGLEPGEAWRHRRIEREGAVLHEARGEGRRRHHLRERRDVEEVVRPERARCRRGQRAVHARVHEAAAAEHGSREGRRDAGAEPAFERDVDRREDHRHDLTPPGGPSTRRRGAAADPRPPARARRG